MTAIISSWFIPLSQRAEKHICQSQVWQRLCTRESVCLVGGAPCIICAPVVAEDPNLPSVVIGWLLRNSAFWEMPLRHALDFLDEVGEIVALRLKPAGKSQVVTDGFLEEVGGREIFGLPRVGEDLWHWYSFWYGGLFGDVG